MAIPENQGIQKESLGIVNVVLLFESSKDNDTNATKILECYRQYILPGCERCLNALPQLVDEQGAVADCGKRAHDVEHSQYRGYNESPTLSRSDLPEATGRVERVRGALLV